MDAPLFLRELSPGFYPNGTLWRVKCMQNNVQPPGGTRRAAEGGGIAKIAFPPCGLTLETKRMRSFRRYMAP
jgi:hypothetical protein